MDFETLRQMYNAKVREAAYFKQQTEDAKGIIAQLHRGFVRPTDVQYIHPLDLAVIFNDLKIEEVVYWQDQTDKSETIQVGNIRYKQSPLMPQFTDKIK